MSIDYINTELTQSSNDLSTIDYSNTELTV
jgi:hypothetical protein